MVYEYHTAGSNVIEYGDAGDKFYIVIRGKVSVLIPKNFRRSAVHQDQAF